MTQNDTSFRMSVFWAPWEYALSAPSRLFSTSLGAREHAAEFILVFNFKELNLRSSSLIVPSSLLEHLWGLFSRSERSWLFACARCFWSERTRTIASVHCWTGLCGLRSHDHPFALSCTTCSIRTDFSWHKLYHLGFWRICWSFVQLLCLQHIVSQELRTCSRWTPFSCRRVSVLRWVVGRLSMICR
jgi:hypothetical protein